MQSPSKSKNELLLGDDIKSPGVGVLHIGSSLIIKLVKSSKENYSPAVSFPIATFILAGLSSLWGDVYIISTLNQKYK